MNMVGHEAIGHDIRLVLVAVFPQPLEIDRSVVSEEHRLASVTPLGDVMGNTGRAILGMIGTNCPG